MYTLPIIPPSHHILTQLSPFQLFMQADFSLEDPATFQQVLPLQKSVSSRKGKQEKEGRSGNKSPSTPEAVDSTPLSSKLLHEKVHVGLSHGLRDCMSKTIAVLLQHLSTFNSFFFYMYLILSLPPPLSPALSLSGCH